MLPTKDLTDVLKSATEVTSLASTDKVQIVDAIGNPKRISKQNLDGNYKYSVWSGATAQRWIRALALPDVACGSITFWNTYNNDRTSLVMFSFLFNRRSQSVNFKINEIFGDPSIYQKVRVVYPESGTSQSFLEIYVKNGNNSFNVELSMSNVEIKIQDGAIPEGFLVKEVDLTKNTANSGGG